MIKLSVPSIGNDECSVVERVLRSGQLVHGEECELFEKELAQYLGCQDVVVVSSGTSALHLSLLALGIGSGDAVLVPDYTFPATVNTVELVGARPILVDVDLQTYNITPEAVCKVLREWTGAETIKAIIPVHEFGCPVNMSAITQIAQEYNLLVIEDAACGLGTVHEGKKVGTLGNVGCFSFHPRKAITTGEGGAVATNDQELASKLRSWRNHGIVRNRMSINFILPGLNYRLTNFQAALGRIQLQKFDSWLKIRHKLQAVYRRELTNSSLLLPSDMLGHAWQTFMVVLPDSINRADIITSLFQQGIETNLGAQCIHSQEYYLKKYPDMCRKMLFNNAEVLFLQGLALPLCQEYSDEQICKVASSLKELLK